MKRAALTVLIGVMAWAWVVPARAADPGSPEFRVEQAALRLEEDFGFRVYWRDIPFNLGPKMAFSPADPADYASLNTFLDLLRGELVQYPAGIFLKTRLKALVLVKRQFYDTAPAEGLYQREQNIILMDFKRNQGNPAAQRRNIHHELFHMIEMQTGGLGLWETWEQANVPGFRYQKKIELAPNQNPHNFYAPSVPGFVTYYAMTSPIEDRAEIFASLMVPEQNRLLRRWSEKDAALRAKVAMMEAALVQFYPGMKAALAGNKEPAR